MLSKESVYKDMPTPADDNVLNLFHEPVRKWFRETFPAPTLPQELGWPAIQRGESTLILAPTGSGKTLTAFLVAIDRVLFDPVPGPKERCRILYISPLKALAVDVEKNLQSPITGVLEEAERLGHAVHRPNIALRTGDTPGKERTAFVRHPADILITTPESLYLMLTSAAREALRFVQCVIVDEVHALVGGKRGAHLSISLERLEELVAAPLQRIGLSATQRPLDEVARFLGGFEPGTRGQGLGTSENLTAEGGIVPLPTQRLGEGRVRENSEHVHASNPRPVTIVDAGRTRQLDLTVMLPAESLQELYEEGEMQPVSAAGVGAGVWAAIPPVILDLVRKHTATLIFVNSRRLAERLAAMLNELAGEEIVQAHHGSIAREHRLQIEEALKSGRLPAMVATSSLELGIDMGSIDLVIQVGAPPSIASGMQRIGRAGHQVDARSTGVILPKFRGDLLSCAALTDQMMHGAVEEMHYPRNPLDVLAQQIVAMVSIQDWRLEDLEAVIRRAAPFAELPVSMLYEVLDMLSGKYPSADFAELRPRITWDRWNNTLTSRQGARSLAITNGGTIADRGQYPIFLVGSDTGRTKGRVGELDEEMVHESKVGDVVLLGASSWRIEEITHDRVMVSPAPGVAGRTPFWHGEAVGRPLEFGRAIGALSRMLTTLQPDEALHLLTDRHALEPAAAKTLLNYLNDQQDIAGAVPNDQTVLIEYTRDELGDWRICVLSPFGAQVHGPWAMAIGAIINARRGIEVDILWADDGIIIRYPNVDDPPPASWFTPSPEEVEELVVRQLGVGGGGARQSGFVGGNALFASRFREAAGRSLLLPRRYPGHRSPLWQTRKRAADLLQAASGFPSFPIILETFREILKDIFDMDALVTILREIERGDVRTVAVSLQHPSPFGSALVFSYVGNFMYEYDAPLAERRAMALQIDLVQLRELMGDADLRSLLDDRVLQELEIQLQHLDPERPVKHADGLHDLLLLLGDLSLAEIEARFVDAESANTALEQLTRERRAVLLTIGGEDRYVAVEDAARIRDALGVVLPRGLDLPDSMETASSDATGDLLARYARARGPITVQEAGDRFGLGISVVQTTLARMALSGRVLEGEFRPGFIGKEWCDAEVLTVWRRRSLARSRNEIEPVDPSALCRLMLSWQGICGASDAPRHSLIEVVEQLQGAAVPASMLESQILTSRLPEYRASELDELMSSGAVVWAGVEPIGQRDGRIRLALAEDASALLTAPEDPDRWVEHPTHVAILEYLSARGASFFAQIQSAIRGFKNETLDALWELVWSGFITNDTLQPVRSIIKPALSDSRAAGRRAALAARTRGMARSHAPATPPEAAGRWSLVSDMVAIHSPTGTERIRAHCFQLLNRYGVLTRESVQAEGAAIPGGFSTLYPVLRLMEESGAIRRGYFVKDLGPTQFALSGAVDRLRVLREPEEEPSTVLLGATDPANPFGAVLPWPERSAGRKPMRLVGSWVVIVDGCLAAWLAPGDMQLVTFLDNVGHRSPEVVAQQIAESLAREVMHARRKAVFLTEIDGAAHPTGPMASALEVAGFHKSEQGYQRKL